MRKYKLSALIGTVMMGIGSYMACLGIDSTIINVGNILLLISILVMGYGFTYWQP